MENEAIFHIFGFGVTLSLLLQWIVMLILSTIAIVGTLKLEKLPSKWQAALEIVVEKINKAVTDNMGKGSAKFIPYIGTLILYLACLNLIGLFGLRPPTSDYNVALGLAIISFFVIQANAIKKIGILHYFKGYSQPYAFLLPLNIVERVVFPISLSLRLFGNMFAATLIMEIVYEGLGHVSWFTMLAIPVPLHAYFDVFDGTLQMIVFVLLTMTNIKLIAEH